jgi:chromatin assembly factor 1 subunit A
VKQLQKHLIPGDDTSSDPAVALLPGPVLESAVTSLASRVNYGVDVSPTGGKLPAALSIWRWEVKSDKRHWLPQSAKDKTEARIAERVQVRSSPYRRLIS